MRAVYYPFDEIQNDERLSITGDSANHLNVVRVRAQEKILILNGKGTQALAEVLEINKNLVELNILETNHFTKKHALKLAIACPKKDAFEDILKMAVELGVTEIYPLSSQFSQYNYEESERLNRIIESALIQSNNHFWPLISKERELGEFIKNQKGQILFFNSQTANQIEKSMNTDATILIGPEGGFSKEEVELILASNQHVEIHLSTPIMRAPTAFATALGYVLGKTKS